MLMCLRLK